MSPKLEFDEEALERGEEGKGERKERGRGRRSGEEGEGEREEG